MKRYKLTRKVQIVLATIFIILAGGIIVGTFVNDKTLAASKTCPKCVYVSMMIDPDYYDNAQHKWMCPSCDYPIYEAHVFDSSQTYPRDGGTPNMHDWYCVCPVCGKSYKYSSGACADNDGDGFCDYCYEPTTNGPGSGGSGGDTEEGYTYDWFDSTLHTVNLDGDFYSREEHTSSSWADQGDGTHWALCDKCGGAARFDHNEVTDAGKPATCTEDGLTDGKHCTDCNAVTVAQEKIPAKGHTEVTDEGKPATCTEDGLTDGKHCSVCNAVTVEQETIPALGHTEVIDEGKEATCTEEGLTEGKHCSVCNEVIVEQEVIPALGHTEVIDEGKEATCTEEGLTEGKHCSVCDEVIVEQEVIPALGHTEVIDEGKEATCTEEGLTEGKHCSVCGETIVEQEVIPALGHTEVIDEGKEATCTEEGLTEGKHCSVCGEILVAQEKIPAKGHNFEDGECTECGEQEFDEIDISSDTYEIENEYISKIQPETTVKEFKDKLQTNAAEINIYNKENEPLEDDDIIGTGMKLELKSGDKTKTFTLIVKGDVNSDGKADMLDITTINQYRLNKASLEEIYLKAGDVTEDTKVDLYDILKINMYRLHKINEL